MRQFLKNNLNFFLFLLFSLIIELSSLYIITGNLFIKEPWFGLTSILIIFAIYNLISKRRIKEIFLDVCFTIQSIIVLFTVILFENTGTLFDFSMLLLIKETATVSTTITLNYWYLSYVIILLIGYIVSSYFISKKFTESTYTFKYKSLYASLALVACLISQFSIIIVTNSLSKEKFMNSLYADSNDKYVSLGETPAFFNEIYKMLFFNKYNDLSNEEITNYIYEEVNTPTSYFGISKDNNLVTILVESFEWFSFISDPSIYPNGANLDEETLEKLYPNIRNFYNMSVVMNNHYAENKTDISEDEALLGVYPNSSYINYGFPNNNMATSIANNLKLQDETIVNSFFHNNTNTFYNREKVATSLGYDNTYFIDDMVDNGATNYIGKVWNLLNLDSEMVEAMSEEMFPSNTRFNTHITTMSMHGTYVYRENFARWYTKMNDLNVNIEDEELKNYMAAVMEFDAFIGLMLNDLEKKDLLDNTTIVIFADHNTYLSNLTYKVKNIDNYNDENYNELFRVPLMIYDPNISHQIVNKFTTTYDITPTILDLFGINYYTNLYYGNSIFSDNESVLYSKAFDVFITDDLLFSNINNILYKKGIIEEEYLIEIEDKCLTLLEKIYYTNHIFSYNYFGNDSNLENYITKVNTIN